MPTIAMLTTYDNPYSPFEDYDEWFAYDSLMGYHTPGLLARVAVLSLELSELDQSQAVEQAIDYIVKENVSGMHRKVTMEV